MLIPYIPPQDLTDIAKPIYEYRQILNTAVNQPSELPQTKKYEKEDLAVLLRTDTTDSTKQNTGTLKEAVKPIRISSGFSQVYVDFQRRSLLRGLSSELGNWISKGNQAGLPSIVNVKRLLTDNANYLDQYQDTRLLLGTLELIFENNEWNTISNNKLQFLKSKVDYLADNELDFDQMKKFIKEIHTSKIRILKPGYGKEAQKEENA